MKKLAPVGIVVLQCLVSVVGCSTKEVRETAGGQVQTGQRQRTSQDQAQPASIVELCREPARYTGQTVVLEGVYQGFRVGECRFPDAARPRGLTRSDWLIRTGEDCLYVTGGAPEGADLLEPEYLGRRLELTARVARDDASKLYLELVDARMLAE